MNSSQGITPTVELATTNGNGFGYPYPVYPVYQYPVYYPRPYNNFYY